MGSTRRGDFTHKQYVYKVYANGFNHKHRHYLLPGDHMNWYLTKTGGFLGNADITKDAGTNTDYYVGIMGTSDSGFGLSGTGKLTSDPIRPAHIKTSDLSFRRSHSDDANTVVNSYYIEVFDYKINFNIGSNTVTTSYKGTTLVSASITSSYDYLRIFEMNDNIYIDKSGDGVMWSNVIIRNIDYDNDKLVDVLTLFADLGGSGAGMCSVDLTELTWHRRDFGFKGIITNQVEDDLEFTTHINTAGSNTTVKIKQDPANPPEYITEGAFVDVYVNYWSYIAFGQSGTILDENNLPILDDNNNPITGIYSEDLHPEHDSQCRFSGYIAEIEEDYDAQTMVLTLVSHGEELSNIPLSTGDNFRADILIQDQQNTSESITSYNRRQTFTLERQQKISGITLRMGNGGAGGDYVTISLGKDSTTIATAITPVFVPAGEYNFQFNNDVILEAGVYWIRPTSASGSTVWYYQNTNVYDGGARQTLSGSTWSNTTTDVYFKLYLNTPDVVVNYSSTPLMDIIDDAFDTNSALPLKGLLPRFYSQITAGDIDDPNRNASIPFGLDKSLTFFEKIQSSVPFGWWWSIDPGTNEYTLKDQATDPDHIFYVGQDIRELKIKRSIVNITNDVYFVGADINDVQNKLAIQTTDIDSIVKYRRGMIIKSDGRVARYDTAQVFSDTEIANGNIPIISTNIEVQAKTYDIESIRAGHMIRIVNTGGKSINLQIASVNYHPLSVNLSLANVPSIFLKNINDINKVLEDQVTKDASNVI